MPQQYPNILIEYVGYSGDCIRWKKKKYYY